MRNYRGYSPSRWENIIKNKINLTLTIHTYFRKSQFFERIESNGYNDFYTVGENIAGGQTSIPEVMKAWLESPAHCTNIMNNTSEKNVRVSVYCLPGVNMK